MLISQRRLLGYLNDEFQPMDIIGMTSFGFMPHTIWQETWAKDKNFVTKVFTPYSRRAHQCTHIAVTVLGKDGRKWIMEMDSTREQTRFVWENRIITPEECAELTIQKENEGKKYRRIIINSGLMLRPFEKYITENIKDDHICWVGRHHDLGNREKELNVSNELLFQFYREGVEYDYRDLFSFPQCIQKLKIQGTEEKMICSELPQRVMEKLLLIPKGMLPLCPMNWQNMLYNRLFCLLSMGK